MNISKDPVCSRLPGARKISGLALALVMVCAAASANARDSSRTHRDAPTSEDVEADNDVNFDNGRGPGRWAQPQVEFEVRFAAGTAIAADTRMLRVSLDSDKGSIDAVLDPAIGKDAQGGALLRGTVSITHRASNRLVVIYVPGQPDRVCESGLAADPPTTGSLGAWRECTMVFDANASSSRAPRAVEAAQLRYKVWRPPVWRDAIR